MKPLTELHLPSGRKFDEDALTLIADMATTGFLRHSKERVRFKSGVESEVYVGGREQFTDNPGLEWLVGRAIAKIVTAAHAEGDKQHCLIGVPTVGAPLAQAAAMVSYHDGLFPPTGVICHRVMREKLKEHGIHRKWVNGDPSPAHTYWLVDNTVVNGDSKLELAPKFIESGYDPKAMPLLIFVDRQLGGVERLLATGYGRIHRVFYLLDIAYALSELNVWPKSVVESVEAEIKAHQFS